MGKFIIFAGARTGSTSLAKVLNESSDVRMALEPFHPNYSKWNPGEKKYSELIKDAESLHKALDELFEKFTAIKVLDYQFPENVYLEMLGREDFKTVFLRRKNLLGQTVSAMVAHQTAEWHKTGDESSYDKLKVLDLTEIQERIDYAKHLNKTYLDFLEKERNGEFLPLFYEELYSENLDENVKTITDICRFLKVAPPTKNAVKKYMTPSKARINHDNLYKKIPNHAEIQDRFGQF